MPLGLSLRALMSAGNIGPISDDFNRPNASTLGITSVGGVPWVPIIGTWGITSNRPTTSTAIADNPHAIVQANTPDVDTSIDVNSSGGGDALYFRVVDASNWLRLRYYGWQSSSTSCQTCYEYTYNRGCSHNLVGECGGVGGGPDCKDKSNCGSCPPLCPTTCCDATSCFKSTTTCDSYSCNCTTTYYDNYRTYFDKMVAGTVSTITYWNGSTSRFRAVTSANTVRVFTGTTDRGVFTVNDHVSATQHGFGRAASSYTGTALDNFDLRPVA